MKAPEFREWRSAHRRTQEQVATQFGVSRQTVQNWESEVSSIPKAVEDYLPVWSRRLRQQDPKSGPVTLVYTDSPMFVPMQGRRPEPAKMHQEAYATNVAALGRVLSLAGSDGFWSPLVLAQDSMLLWNSVELAAVIRGQDKGAPTLRNILREAATHLRVSAGYNVRTGRFLTSEEYQSKIASVALTLADELDQISDLKYYDISIKDRIEEIIDEARDIKKQIPNGLVSDISNFNQGYFGVAES